MRYPQIAKKIIDLRDADLDMRERLISKGVLSEGYHPEMEKLHILNAKFLGGIIDSIGYPTADKVGKEANQAAWLVIQHAISLPAFMKRCLKLLRETKTDDNQSTNINLAYLSDRIAVFEDRPQYYGTQFDWDQNGKLSPNPYDDIEKVNQRRKSIGLLTLEEQTKIIRQQAKNENQSPPVDLEKRNAEMNRWKRKVGWIL